MFEFVVAEASLREVIAQDKPGFTQWVYDVLDTWLRLLYCVAHFRHPDA